MTHPEKEWQDAIDRAAYFNIIGLPDSEQPNTSIPAIGGSGSIAGVHVNGVGHRFDVTVYPPTVADGLRAQNTVGQQALKFSFDWLLIPQDFAAAPGQTPPPIALDSSRPQRFALMNAEFSFGESGKDRFSSIGTGRTFPLSTSDGKSIRIAGIGAILEGSGKFQGSPGVYVISGIFTPPDDFRFNILIRTLDTNDNLLTDGTFPALQPIPSEDTDITYLYVRTAAEPETTQLTIGPGGAPKSIVTNERITLDHLDFAEVGSEGLKSKRAIGQVIGQHPLSARFFATPDTKGTSASPVPFDDVEDFIFTDEDGNTIGTVHAPVVEGRAILTSIEGVPNQIGPQLFGGFAPIVGGTGHFADAKGIVTNVGGGTAAPHLTDLLYVFELDDPTGKYRVAD